MPAKKTTTKNNNNNNKKQKTKLYKMGAPLLGLAKSIFLFWIYSYFYFGSGPK